MQCLREEGEKVVVSEGMGGEGVCVNVLPYVYALVVLRSCVSLC